MDARHHVRAILLLPFMATLAVPAAIVLLTDPDAAAHPGGWIPDPWSIVTLVIAGLLIAAGLGLLIETIRLFARVGRGTLAPWDATSRLVVRGPYRHVRNPMISGVVMILLGETMVIGSIALLGWLVLFAAANAAYMPLVEERALARRFGSSYEEYCRNVPRWIPRLRPWSGDGD